MLIAKQMSADCCSNVPDLRSRFSGKLNDHYQLGTMTGKLYLFFYALVHFSSPSSFLAKQLDQHVQYYVTNAGKLRAALYRIDASYKAGLMPGAISFRLSDATVVNLVWKVNAGQIDSLYVRDEQTGTWESLGLTHSQLLEKIENDMLGNSELFDARLVASCKLKPAFENIEALQKSICSARLEQARKEGKFNPDEFDPGSSDDFQACLVDPHNLHGQFFIAHAEAIAANLVRSGFYGTLHPDEANFKEFQLCSLHTALMELISQGLNPVLPGSISGTTQPGAATLRLLHLIPRNIWPEEIVDKLTLIERGAKT